jgi:hypothetical protein
MDESLEVTRLSLHKLNKNKPVATISFAVLDVPQGYLISMLIKVVVEMLKTITTQIYNQQIINVCANTF